MDSGFGMFRDCLRYKLERQGKPYVVLDRYSPTAKTCHACGHVYDGLTLRERSWTCPACGATVLRERNAAENIRDWGISQIRHQQATA
jgi:putative transposase